MNATNLLEFLYTTNQCAKNIDFFHSPRWKNQWSILISVTKYFLVHLDHFESYFMWDFPSHYGNMISSTQLITLALLASNAKTIWDSFRVKVRHIWCNSPLNWIWVSTGSTVNLNSWTITASNFIVYCWKLDLGLSNSIVNSCCWLIWPAPLRRTID